MPDLTPQHIAARIARGAQVQEQALLAREKAIRYYRGKFTAATDNKGKGGGGAYTVNITYPNLRVLSANLYYRDPDITLEAADPAEQPVVELYEKYVRQEIARIRLKRTAKQCLFDSLVGQRGAARVWFTAAEAEDGSILAPSSGITIRRLRPRDYGFDPDADSLDNAAWTYERQVYSLDEFRTAFPGQDPDKLPKVARRTPEDDRSTIEQQAEPLADGWSGIEVYLFDDWEGGELYFCAQGGAKVLERRPHPYAFLGRPNLFELALNPIPDTHDALSVVDLIRVQQDEVNEIRDIESRQRRRRLGKWWHNQSLTAAGLSALEGRQLEALVELDGSNRMADAFGHVDENIPADSEHEQYQIAKDAVREILGISSMRRGVPEPGAETAYEVREMQASGDALMGEHEDTVRTWLQDLLQAAVDVAVQYADMELVLDVAGEARPFNPAQAVRGKLQLTVQAFSTQRPNDLADMAKWDAVLDKAVAMAQLFGPQGLREIARDWLRSRDIADADVDRYLPPQPQMPTAEDPQAQLAHAAAAGQGLPSPQDELVAALGGAA